MADEDDELVRRARRVRKALRVDGALSLAAIDPRSTPGLPSKQTDKGQDGAWSRGAVKRIGELIADHQERLYAGAATGAGRRRVLLVLQAMDCGGKDGTVKSVVGAINPLGVRVTAFKAPTEIELAHHFLWRISRALPEVGYIGVFNRSHYEDVLAVRVRRLASPDVWRRRYEEINDFERAQSADGMTIIKVMLHISRDEQRQRLLARLDDPTKRWKFNPDDLDDRGRWDAYQDAYAEALSRCSTRSAPWYVVPADRKWYRNWAVANLLLAHLDDVSLEFPRPEYDVAAERARLLEVEHRVNK